MKKRFSEEQIIGFLKQADAGMAVKDLCCKHGFSEAIYLMARKRAVRASRRAESQIATFGHAGHQWLT